MALDREESIKSKKCIPKSETPTAPTLPSHDSNYISNNEDLVNIQKVLKEGILIASGAHAILLQIANPAIARGVNENSNFASRPSDRLRTTMIYMYCVAFGTPEEKAAISEKVHQAHERVEGTGYNAHDPQLQLWVAATLYVAGVGLYEQIFGALNEDTAEKVYIEYAVMATSLRVTPEMWPESREEFWKYWQGQIETLDISADAKQVVRNLLHNKSAPIWIRVNLPMVRLLTAGWLPPRMREEYGLKTSKRRRKLHRLSMGAMRNIYPLLPSLVRESPLNIYMNNMRKRIKERGEDEERRSVIPQI